MDEKLSHPDITSRKGWYPAAASTVIRHLSVLSPLQTLSRLQRVASHLKIRSYSSQEASMQQLTQGEKARLFCSKTKITLKDILISYLPSGSGETTVQICQAVEPPSPSPASPTDGSSTVFPTTHWPPPASVTQRHNLLYIQLMGDSLGPSQPRGPNLLEAAKWALYKIQCLIMFQWNCQLKG